MRLWSRPCAGTPSPADGAGPPRLSSLPTRHQHGVRATCMTCRAGSTSRCASRRGHAWVGARGNQLDDLSLHVQTVAGAYRQYAIRSARRARWSPAPMASPPATSKRMVTAAVCQPLATRPPNSDSRAACFIQMKRLRIELCDAKALIASAVIVWLPVTKRWSERKIIEIAIDRADRLHPSDRCRPRASFLRRNHAFCPESHGISASRPCLRRAEGMGRGRPRVRAAHRGSGPRRCRPEYVEAISRISAGSGLRWREPVLYQSARHSAYEEALERAGRRGLTYPCFCTRSCDCQHARPR